MKLGEDHTAPEPDLLGEVYVRLDEEEECVEVRGVLVRACSTARALLNL